MKYPDNIQEVLALRPDYIGFIFHPGSARFAGELDATWVGKLNGVKKTGVFVNEDSRKVSDIIRRYGLHAVQLHGDESPEYCKVIRENNVAVLKAFGIDETFAWSRLDGYMDVVDYFLFDTQTARHGGSGKVFDWGLLSGYKHDKPYFLSGGISRDNIREALQLRDDRLYALDLNSKFEAAPGLKDAVLLKDTFELIEHE